MKTNKNVVLIMLGMTALLTLASVARADSISFTDDWQDSVQSGAVVSQDTGTFSAILTVPGLSGSSPADLESTIASISFGDISFSDALGDANSLSTSSAKFLLMETDNNGNTVSVGTLTFSYSGDVVKISGQVKNPLSAPPFPIIADQYLGTVGLIQDQQPLEISFNNGSTINYDLQKTVYITGTGSVTNNSLGDTLNTVKVSGAANFTPPTLSFISPAAKVRLTNPSVTVEVSARDTGVVTNVEFSLNDGGLVSATQGLSNIWSAGLDLSPGTNVIQAYAVDADGYVSTTNSLTVQYVVVSLATVDIDGQGSVSPDYNGELLQVGANYSMTAKAAKGFDFVNWTDGSSNVLTTDATLKFEMASNAVFFANFADITRPTLTITSPKTGEKWSNDVFTVTGTAQDNVAVASVWLSLNAGAWTQISLLPNGNWSTPVTLTPGTNAIAAFAVDTSGNDSLTNTVKLDYILSAQLTVQITGSGTLSPDYNNDFLAIGSRYTMKATAAKGFAFNYWSGTNVTMSTNPELTFTMASNLVITANFKDVTRPTLSITEPVANQRVSNTVITVSGKAADNVGVTAVGVRINGGDWLAADLANGGSNWTAVNLPVSAGTNLVQAYAMDAAGNLSLTNEVKFIGVFPPDWAPDVLTGSTVWVTPANGDPVSVSFDATNFNQTDPSTNGNSGVGNYQYAKDTTNIADLFLTFQAPPTVTNGVPQDIQLTFTNLNAGVFTNLASLDTGLFAVVPATDLLPTTWSGHTITATHSDDSGTTTVSFKSGNMVSITKSNSTASASYAVKSFSPVGAMVVVTYDEGSADFGDVAYLQLTFTSKTQGNYEVNSFDNSGSFLSDDFGSFTWK